MVRFIPTTSSLLAPGDASKRVNLLNTEHARRYSPNCVPTQESRRRPSRREPLMLEQRRRTRFPLALPITIFSGPGKRHLAAGVTENISSKGVRFTTDVPLRVGQQIIYVVALHDHACGRPVDLRCVGTIVRTDELAGVSGARHAVAAKLHGYGFFSPEKR